MKGMVLYVVILPIAIYLCARWFDQRLHNHGSRRLLVMACLTFSLSAFLPSPIINGTDTQFWTHFVGGGMFCGMIWLYFRRSFGVRAWWVELCIVYTLTSALGVLNELYELFAFVYLDAYPVTDTSWDLLANSSGAVTFYILYKTSAFLNDRHKN